MNLFTEGVIDINNWLVVLSVFLGLTLGGFLLFVKSGKNRANIFLGFILLLYTSYFLPVFIFLIGYLETFPHITKTFVAAPFFIAPLIYFYVRSCTQKDFKIKPLMWLVFLPGILNILIHMPFYLSSGAEKVQGFQSFFENGKLNEYYPIQLIKILHGLVYWFISTRIAIRYKTQLEDTTSFIDTGFHRWLLGFCSILMIPILTIILFVFTGEHLFSLKFVYLSIFIFFFTIYTLMILKPELFHDFPHKMLLPEVEEAQKQKYESSGLQESQKEKYVAKLVDYVEKEKPFHEPELTLNQLAEQVNIPSHYLSQVVNEKLECNFLDFINGYRVKEVKEKFSDPKFDHFTIIALAYEVGFNSKTAFYSAFKKHTGTTPGNYRKSVKTSTTA